jgi:hypothetical protein
MDGVTIPKEQWRQLLSDISKRRRGVLVSMEIHDRETSEDVASQWDPLQSIELDLEDERNPRINVTVRAGAKEIKRILFRPSELTLYGSEDGDHEAIRIVSLNTSTTVRFGKTAA